MITILLAFLLVPQLQPRTSSGVESQEQRRMVIEHIANVRVDRDNDFLPDRLGDTVTIAGRANVGTGVLHRERLHVFIQDASAGIELFSKQVADPIQTGDSVIATGVVGQYNGLTQLRVILYEVVETHPVLPEPRPITVSEAHSEKFEGMLVRVQGRIVNKRVNRGGQYILLSHPEESDEIIAAFVRDFHRPVVNFDDYSIGDEIMVTGILGQYDFDPPYAGILPDLSARPIGY
jgi:hypothetical protein